MKNEAIAVLLEVARFAELLAPIFVQGSKGRLRTPSSVKELAKIAGVSTARLETVREALASVCRAGAAVKESETTWRLTLSPAVCYELSLMLLGIAVYRTKVHEDADRVSVVLSRPPSPSIFSSALAQSLRGDWGLQETGDTFQRMAVSADRRFLVMTPFLDADGLDRVLSLFEMTHPKVERCLVVRQAHAQAIIAAKQRLAGLSVSVFEFRLAKGAGQYETFHAKVVVADNNQCYLGSSNMTTWSFNYSLELGFYVQGASARRAAETIDAVLAVSPRKM
ncbi:phospholipase D-like domain-containing protein [Achromobacter sp. 2789STDY5608621]|jgi:hypothetical protein|uniref:phospholipase D-like domain-containing protein n=1 Tax=Achromobacter sp. 2789STDY5608621 TaxID=1806496 RepID=UPI0006C04409|nr:phospholipase D-like domain-containing protein [Achromobacter sp. 2789STDY5608621]CUJ48475.1 Uncharacterised protein [Achromobacter sp. 2789STDY5608621]